MSKKSRDDRKTDRRKFLRLIGAAGAANGLPLVSVASAADQSGAPETGAPGHASMPAAGGVSYEFFNVEEAAFVEAAVEALIPADREGPGALETGVATYIDRQMAGAHGKGDRLYLEGPFREGLPQQGYQLAMMPSELMRAGISDVNSHALKNFRKEFAALAAADRSTVLSELEDGKAELLNVPADTFFALLLQLTIEGYFADPMYGGNRNKASWKMIGFPGAGAMYADKIEPFRNRPYTAEPVGIEDLA